jgi:hypothetical protein
MEREKRTAQMRASVCGASTKVKFSGGARESVRMADVVAEEGRAFGLFWGGRSSCGVRRVWVARP